MIDEQEKCVVEADGFECPIKQFEDNQSEDEVYISHTMTTTRGDIFYAYRSIELEEELPNGEFEIVIAIDAINHPEKGDRSIIMIPKRHIESIQKIYDKDGWNELMRAAFCSQCEQMLEYSGSAHVYGIYQ